MIKKEDKRKDKIKDAQLHISVNKEEKEEAQRILEECGTTINSVVQMLLKYIINYKGLPFPVTLPSDLDDIEEVERTDKTEIIELKGEVHKESLTKGYKKDKEKAKGGEELTVEGNLKVTKDDEIEFFNLFDEEN